MATKRNHTIRCFFFMLFAFPGFVFSQQADASMAALKRSIPAIDSIYQAFAVKYHSPGVAYAIVYNGEVVHQGTWGYSDIERQIPVSPHTVFRAASMTKSFVAAAILQLRDAGKLDLDHALERYIPEFGAQRMLTADAPKITIRHLLTHMGGFPEDNPWGDRQLDISDEEFAELIRNGFSFSNAPGVTYEYSNTGYALLGEVIKRITGQRYDAYIKANLFTPLEMHNSYWAYTDVPDGLLAHGYRWTDGQWIKQPMLDDGAYGAMGGLSCSLEDFARYVAFFLDAWPARDDTDDGPLKRSSLREMQQPWTFNRLTDVNGCPVTSAYGYGLRWTHDCNGITTVGHSGGLPGFGCNWLILPDHGLGIVSFSNVTYAPATTINNQVAGAIIRLSGITARQIPVSTVLKQRQNELVRFLPHWEGAETSEIFATNFFLDNDIHMLRKESQAMFATAGKITGLQEIVAENNLRGTFIIVGEHHDIAVHFTLSPEEIPRIQQVTITKHSS